MDNPEVCDFTKSDELSGVTEMDDPEPRDFTKSDELSDVVLIVEKTKLYVHRQYLAEWSAVWRTMFLTNFAHKHKAEIALPGKKLDDILQLLGCIYPSQNPITESNVEILLSLAEEYMMERITQKCEDYLLEKTPNLATLVTAQRYNLKRLFKVCVEFAKNCCLEDIEQSPEFIDLKPHTVLAIYKSKVDSLREYAYYLKENNNKVRAEHEALKLQHEKTLMYAQTLESLWDLPSKRCYRHITNEEFDFSCVDCNRKLHRQVRKLCNEMVGMRKVYLNHGTFSSSRVSTSRDKKT